MTGPAADKRGSIQPSSDITRALSLPVGPCGHLPPGPWPIRQPQRIAVSVPRLSISVPRLSERRLQAPLVYRAAALGRWQPQKKLTHRRGYRSIGRETKASLRPVPSCRVNADSTRPGRVTTATRTVRVTTGPSHDSNAHSRPVPSQYRPHATGMTPRHDRPRRPRQPRATSEPVRKDRAVIRPGRPIRASARR